ncbi:MAG: zinc-binding dehydrogenase [Leptolyngbya sp. SIO3F4]|nr:zinc-binding dehydrogenase [Leptolyngbya sp. SIO3F4]
MIRLFSKKRVCLVSLKPNQDLDYVNQLFEAGDIKPVLDGPYTLRDLPKMIQYFGAGKHQGKVVIALE